MGGRKALRLPVQVTGNASQRHPLFQTLGKHGPYQERGLTHKAVDCLIKSVVKKALIQKRVHPHVVRHTFATTLLDKVNDLKSAQALNRFFDSMQAALRAVTEKGGTKMETKNVRARKTGHLTSISTLTLTLALILIFHPCLSFSAIPQKINYQGYMTDSGGIPIVGSVTMTFSIYDVSTGGTALWTEVQTVTVTSGIYSVDLGDVTPVGLTFDVPYYLGIKVGTDSEMTPRVLLTSVGYAFRAKTAEVDHDTLAGLSCTSGQIPKMVGGVWTCAQDNDTTYSAGTGLGLTGTQFSTDTSYVQRRVTGTCDSGNAIRVVNADGSVTCEPVASPTHDHDSIYVKKTGDTMTGTLSVYMGESGNAVQALTTGTGHAGYFETSGDNSAIKAVTTGTSHAGRFEASNASAAIKASNFGPGPAGYFEGGLVVRGDVYVTGNTNIAGNLSKFSGSFVQPHPKDPTKEVVYAFFGDIFILHSFS